MSSQQQPALSNKAGCEDDTNLIRVLKESPEKVLWLLGTNRTPPTQRLSATDFDVACAFALRCWHVLPLTYPKLLALNSQLGLDGPAFQRVRDRTACLNLLARLQVKLCQRLTRELEKQNVPYALLKGTAVRFLAYDDPALRCGLDVDLGVPRHALRLAEQVLQSQGFVAAQWSPETLRYSPANLVLRALVESRHYELGYYVRSQVIENLEPEDEAAIRRELPECVWYLTKDDQPACYVTIDLHHGLCLDIEVDPMVASAQRASSEAGAPLVPQPEWIAFHLIYKIYWEGCHEYGTGGYQYADLIRLLPFCSGEHELALIKLLEQYRLEAGGYYVLRRIESAFGIPLSATLKNFVAGQERTPANATPAHLNDLGDMWPKLWGFR